MLDKILAFVKSGEMLTVVGRGVQYASQIALVMVVPAVLAPEEFLQFSLMMPLAALGMSLVFGWLTSAIHRHVFELLDPKDARFRQTASVYYGMVSLFFISLSLIGLLITDSMYRILPFLLVMAGLKMSIIRVLNSSGNHLGFFLANISFALSTAIFIALCMVDSNGGLEKNLVIYAAIDVLISLIAWRHLGVFSISPQPIFDRAIALKYFRYGFPLVANAIAIWVISLSDRYILTIWEGTNSVASYILSYQLASNIISIPLAFAATIFFPRILRIEREQDEPAALEYTYKLLSMYLKFIVPISLSACVLVMLFVYYLYSDYMFSPFIIILVVIAHVIYGSAHFYNKEFELSGRTMVITKGVALGAGLNFLMNLLLIPLFGILGAAIATLLAYIVVIWWVYNAREFRVD